MNEPGKGEEDDDERGNVNGSGKLQVGDVGAWKGGGRSPRCRWWAAEGGITVAMENGEGRWLVRGGE